MATTPRSDTTTYEALTQAMQEYANAIRGDWSDFDGRSERSVIESWINEIAHPSGASLEDWRSRLGICRVGGGHWCGRWGHCTRKTGRGDYSDKVACDCPCTKGGVDGR